MAITERTETYWHNGRLYPVTILRPSGRGPWIRQHTFEAAELVSIIEGKDGEFNIFEGPSATTDRVNDSILLHRGISPRNFTTDIWGMTPMTLLTQVSNKIRDAEQVVSSQWRRFSNEEAATGALFSRLEGQHTVGRWSLDLTFVEFSKQTKEPLTGTDIAVILDAKAADGRRSIKTLWLQAKREKKLPTDPYRLPRFEDQAMAAELFTEDFYGIVYTPEGVFVTGTNIDPHPSLHAVIQEAMECRLGDTTVRTLKNSLNRKRVFEIALTENR